VFERETNTSVCLWFTQPAPESQGDDHLIQDGRDYTQGLHKHRVQQNGPQHLTVLIWVHTTVSGI